MKDRIGKILVVGGGISGIKSALDLAETGYSVVLIDRAPYLGGILSQLDYQFPTDHCGMCKMLPLTNRDASSQYCMRKGFAHRNIDIKLTTELVSVEGDPGKYNVTIRRQSSGVDPDLCTGCGKCIEKCPIEVPDTFNLGLEKRKAIYLPVPHNFPHVYTIDFEACNLCGDCVEVCPTHAINLSNETLEPVLEELEVGAVILSGGTDYYDPSEGKNTYGYGIFPDVVTGREFERLISGTGSTEGRLVRRSDGEPVRKIAWFQCVGSRDIQENADFCSSVCCMHAIKEARLAHEKTSGEIDTTVFYMDLRTFGKSFQRYRDEAESRYDVKFQRARVHTVTRDRESGQLLVKYVGHDSDLAEDRFDMIVLSTGQRPSKKTKELADATGISLNQWGFCEPTPFSSVIASRDGIILSGSYTGLKDISESLIQAGSAAMAASSILHSSGGSLAAEETTDDQSSGGNRQLPEILVALCHHQTLFDEPMDTEHLSQQLKSDPYVNELVETKDTDFEQLEQELKSAVKEHGSNRLLIATGLPHLFRKRMTRLSKAVNLDPDFIDIADIHPNTLSGVDAPNGSISAVIKTGVAKLKHSDREPKQKTSVYQRAMVIGGGIAGISAALSIANNGYEVDLIEKDETLGGNLQWIDETLEGNNVKTLLEEKRSALENHSLIHTYLNSEVVDCFGYAGNFNTVLTKGGEEDPVLLNHGTIVLATGGTEARTSSYCYEESEKIKTQKEFEKGLADSSIDPKSLDTVVMIQCVNSREEPRNYCSRVCCGSSLKNAIKLKKQNPDMAVYVLYRDLMAYGFQESYFTEARGLGVIFIPYETDRKPVVSVDGEAISLKVQEPLLQKELELAPDLLVLATGIEPSVPQKLMDELGVEIDRDGFFREAESKWRPLDSLKDGVFACGICLSPRNITESITSGEAAAQRSLRILCDDRLYAGKTVAQVRHVLCSQCEQCIGVCPYGARSLNPDMDLVTVNPALCQGCGSCAVACPNSATVLEGFIGQQMFEIIDSIVSTA